MIIMSASNHMSIRQCGERRYGKNQLFFVEQTSTLIAETGHILRVVLQIRFYVKEGMKRKSKQIGQQCLAKYLLFDSLRKI